MPKIAIIDDREALRTSLMRRINLLLKKDWKGWECCALHPYDTLTDYLCLFDEDDDGVAVIIVDERLHEGASAGSTNVDYSGTKLAAFIREHKPEFPIFMITSHHKDITGNDRALFEELLDREDFRTHAAVHVERMVRSGQRFTKVFEDELSELSKKAAAVAKKKAKPGDIKRLKALTQKLGIAFEVDKLNDKSSWLEKLDATVIGLSVVADKLEEELKPHKKRRK